jgi:hypothetical protein
MLARLFDFVVLGLFDELGAPRLPSPHMVKVCSNLKSDMESASTEREMARKFGRFELGKENPAEVYDGDYMTLDNKGFVRILNGDPGVFESMATPPRLVTAIHLDKGQSVREMSQSAK